MIYGDDTLEGDDKIHVKKMVYQESILQNFFSPETRIFPFFNTKLV